ncbi:winged helix-turn-helix transcriptional regulator [Paenibacillus agilis]|uniref:Helix-turn-helix transcriptional regulator n=1 Tax=Paenibacillus agilis TaxID=3020863 RepID=A0A559IPS8_9BACL|nr:helix-turn-helix domain-containing protein [Paenibacillus agilis]TVX89649.1 helix-turn-helix transcriptional regulator [Paenibacillus agilis]
MEKKDPDLCKVENTLHILIGKWKPLIIMHLMFGGTKRFSDLQRALAGITTKTLTTQLRELEEQEIILRVVYPVVPPRVEYSITEYGMTLQPVLHLMHEWGNAHLERQLNKEQSTFNNNQ